MALLVTYCWNTSITVRFWQHGQNLAPNPPRTTDTKSRSYSLLQNSSASDHTPLSRHVIVGDSPGCLANPGRQVYFTVFPTEKSISFLCSSFSSAKGNLVGAPQPPIGKEKRYESQTGPASQVQAHKQHCCEERGLVCLEKLFILINAAIIKQKQRISPKDSRGSGSCSQNNLKSPTLLQDLGTFWVGVKGYEGAACPWWPRQRLPERSGLMGSIW